MIRAVLSPSKVVLIDEATANIDADTDNQLQEVNNIINNLYPRFNYNFAGYTTLFGRQNRSDYCP